MFLFGLYCLFRVRPSDHIVVYNFAFEYILGVMVLYFRRQPAILDIEDSPRIDETGFRGAVNRILFPLFCRITATRKLVVSERLAKDLHLKDYCVVYGAIESVPVSRQIDVASHWSQVAGGAPLSLHYGGSLCVETGLDLFCGAVERLFRVVPRDRCYLRIVVTGFGGFGSSDRIKKLQALSKHTGISVEFYGELTRPEYLRLMISCHAALALKLPDSEMGKTTFPSKVVEITSLGLLLISTSVSDVPQLFDRTNAVLLSKASASELASTICSVLNNAADMAGVAIRGRDRAYDLFGQKAVGLMVSDFVLGRRVSKRRVSEKIAQGSRLV
ncbi:glycosyltransferase [Thiocapsa rosea]|uniref:glycosyltransferase n=1 Tax=Thiocapsa rosea TaxID=69360 RepID=UPI0014766509|nr:glycosyltransferase [Thiocapsa rosea]